MAWKIKKNGFFYFFSPISQTVYQSPHLNTQKSLIWLKSADFKTGHPRPGICTVLGVKYQKHNYDNSTVSIL